MRVLFVGFRSGGKGRGAERNELGEELNEKAE